METINNLESLIKALPNNYQVNFVQEVPMYGGSKLYNINITEKAIDTKKYGLQLEIDFNKKEKRDYSPKKDF